MNRPFFHRLILNKKGMATMIAKILRINGFMALFLAGVLAAENQGEVGVYGGGCLVCAGNSHTAGNSINGGILSNGGNSSSGGTGGSGASCKKCESGMTVWEVSEPSINVWLYDVPLAYQPGRGSRVEFKLAYKQRDVETYGTPRTISPYIFSVGTNWNCSWISYVKDDGGGATATMFVAGGGVRIYLLESTIEEYYSNTTMHRTTDINGQFTGFIVSYANGAKDYYQFVPSEQLDMRQVAFLTAKVDHFGHTNQFVYQDANGVTTLRYVIDADGRTNTLFYNNTNPSQITGVQDPFGHSITIQYGSTGVITNITDAAGLNSFMQYDSQGWVTNLTTPYGSTIFQYPLNYDNWGTYKADEYTMVRGVKVIDAAGGTNVYMLRQNSQYVDANGLVPFLYDPNWSGYYYTTNGVCDNAAVPVNTPLAVNNIAMYYRNSFYWGPKQAAGLPNDLTTFAPSDFIKARMRHWLHDTQTGELGQTLGMEQAPSPDGVTAGQTTWYAYDVTVSVLGGSYSQPGLIARVIPDGTTWYTWYQRDEWGRATNVVDTYSSGCGLSPQTRTNTYLYDVNGVNLIQHIGPSGETNCYGYDANNDLLFATNALNEVTAYTYDSQGNLTSITSPAGLTTTNIYYTSGSGANFVQKTIDLQINRTNSYTYTNDLVYTHTDERGLTITNTWDALNRLVREDHPDGTYITNSYYRLDFVKAVDRMGLPTSYGYDQVRRLIAVTNALGKYTLYNYCPCGGLESIRDAANNFTYFTYDNAGNRLSATYPDNSAVSYHYDLLGRLTNTVDSAGVSVTNWYNNQGLRYAVSNAAGQVSLIAYDVEDRATNTIDANNVSINLTYDLLGRVLTRTYPDNGVEKFGYTFGVSGRASYTNQIGNVVTYAYDTMGRKTNEVYVGVTTNGFSYNGAGDLLTLTDGKNQTTAWGYDQYGRVTNKVDATSTPILTYQYDPDNRLTNRWSAAKGTTIYRYDAVGNLTNVDYSGGTSYTSPLYFFYDALNRSTNMVDGVGTTAYSYDAAGQLLSEDGPWANDTVNYTYQNRLRTGLGLSQPSGSWSQSYGYDVTRRLTNVTSPAGAFNYTLGGASSVSPLIQKLLFPNGAYITNNYDSMARLLSTKLLNSSSSILDSESYAYNQASQRTAETNVAGDFRNYTYDNEGELTSAISKEAGGANRWQEQFGYTYDAAGNLNYRTNNALVQTFNVNNLNELTTATHSGTLTVAGTTTTPATSVTVNTSNAILYADATFASTNQTLTSAALNTYTAIAQDIYGRVSSNTVNVFMPAIDHSVYDLNGNLLSEWSGAGGTNRIFNYDDENQLTNVCVTNAWREDFVYDGKMRRRIERDYRWDAGTSGWIQTNEIHFIYDGNVVIQERNANNNPLVTYTRGNDLSATLQGVGGIGGLLARTDYGQEIPGSPNTAYYHADGNGNVTCLIYANQIIAAKYLYDPYGNTLSLSGPLASLNVYRFSSKEWNTSAGLYYYLYRFYDPMLQRWPNRDPIGENGGINLYSCVDNNPVNNIDPFGLDTCTCDRKIGGGPAKPRGHFWNTTPSYSHTFTFTTNPDGTIKHTYSWGNAANTHGWNLDQSEDITAAKEALQNGYNWNEGGKDLDPFVDQAFNELNKKENEHSNLGVARNCKTETEKLLDKAKADQKASK